LVPVIDDAAWVHPQAVVIGDVTIAASASIWPCAVLRGDFGRISIGPRTSIQDGTVVHTTPDHPTIVGASCVVGHNAYLEGCTLEDEVLVGSLAAVLPLCVVGFGAVVAAGATVVRGTRVPARALALGVPARVEPDAVEAGRWAAGVQRYVDMASRYRLEMREVG
jgi:carbonic anhydrase/acetyltransferase-like protein (isoleucine patch superfamily)